MSTTRHRGPWLDWRPQKATVALLDQIQTVLNEYRDHLPLTARQVFYRLVGAHEYPKTEKAYARLLEALVNARRAGIIDFGSIRDDGITAMHSGGYDDKADFYAEVGMSAYGYRRSRQRGQKSRVEIWCEAAGMVPQMSRVAEDYGISVYSSSGFDSLTAKYHAANRAADAGSLIVLHVGDHDPSGVHLFNAAYEDVQAWAEHFSGKVYFERVAVTPKQFTAYGLPTAPPKASDRRAFHGETCQAEALDPATLADILTAAIEGHLDMDVYRDVVDAEETERDELIADMQDRMA